MKKKNIIIIICISIVLLAILAGIFWYKNSNDSFFEDFNNDKGWKIYNYEFDVNENCDAKIEIVDDGYEGKAIMIATDSINDVRIHRNIKVQPNADYQLSVMVKTKTSERGNGFYISALGCFEGQSVHDTQGEWQKQVMYIRTLENQNSINFSLGIGGYSEESSGYVYLDNFQLEKIENIPSGEEVISFVESLYTEENSIEQTQDMVFSKFLFATIVFFLIIYAVMIANKSHGAVREKHKLDKMDYIIMAALTIIGAIISFYHLGNHKVANTFWKPGEKGEYITIELEEETEVKQIAHYGNVPTGGYYKILYSSDGNDYQQAITLGEYTDDDLENIKVNTNTQKQKSPFFQWQFDDVNFTCKFIKIEVAEPNWRVNEIAFYQVNDNGEYEKLNFKIIDSYYSDKSVGEPSMLFDEQDLVPETSNYMNSTYFDEVYFPRTAYEQLNGWSIYETTHPPFGKILMSIGIMLFGMNPFGWRFMGTLFGILLIPLMYLFAMKIFNNRKCAFAAAFLILFDFMRLSHSRLATIDSFSTFFVLAMYYFMFDYFIKPKNHQETGNQKEKLNHFLIEMKPLFLCGLMFGLGTATKWSCLYAGAGLALIFFIHNIAEFLALKKEEIKDWILKRFIPTCLCCVVFFIIIPLIIYVLSYVPYMASHPYESLWDVVLENQTSMYEYHSKLNDTHPYESKWYTWPYDIRPIWIYGGPSSIEEGKASTIASFGNPLIWIPATFAIIFMIFVTLKEKDRKALLLLIAYAFQLIPWMLPNRSTFIYAYFLATPYAILLLVYAITKLSKQEKLLHVTLAIYLLLVFIVFILFFPVISGQVVDASYVEALKWLPTWTF